MRYSFADFTSNILNFALLNTLKDANNRNLPTDAEADALGAANAPSADNPFLTSAGVNDLSPWLIDIDPFLTAIYHVNWDTNVPYAGTLGGGTHNTDTDAVDNEINFDVVLGAGTWTVRVMFLSASNAGIMTLTLDGASLGTIDNYSASIAPNVAGAIAGIIVATPGKRRLKIKMSTKNASSSAYACYLQKVQLQRTA